MIAVATFAICGAIFSFYMLFRNEQVLRLRLNLLMKIREQGLYDIENGKKSRADKRIEALETVSYNSMLHRFWLPVKAEYFYKDLWFINE